MLLELSIKNFVIIEHETINFTPGLNVMTGETGAGKSLVIDAINAIAGGRLSKEDIRQGSQKANVEALISYEQNLDLIALLDEYGITQEEDNTLLISREVNTSGRAVCRVNGQIVTLSMLKSITENLIDIVGQNEHQLLLNVSRHLDFVDNFGGREHLALREELKGITEHIKQYEAKLEDVCGNAAERERRLDLYSFQLNEIEAAGLKAEEEIELKNRKILLSNAEKLFKSLSSVYINLFKGEGNTSSVVDIIGDCIDNITDAAAIDSSLDSFKAIIENVLYQLEDLKNDIRQYRDNIEFNDSEVDTIEERLDLINKLKRKYGSTIEEVLDYKESVSKQHQELVNSEKLALELETKIDKEKKHYFEKAEKLSGLRRDAAKRLEKLVEKQLQELNMSGARFKIMVTTDLSTINSKGIDKAEFMISPNPGEAEKPLSKIASGGEMSRIMLAIKNVLSNSENLGCIVFDEVDAGIGGVTAAMVGQKIKSISKLVQAVCITHLPQIAAYGDNHILIDKTIEEEKTFTKMRILNKESRINEIARMLGGDEDSKASINHAKELIKSSV